MERFADGEGMRTREGVFSPDVNYIYRKQLEEAEIIVINKTDVVQPGRLARLREALAREYPEAAIMAVASRDGAGLEPLFEALTTREGQIRKVMDVDYARYGMGEAMLGWYNGQHEIEVAKGGVRRAKAAAGRGSLGVDGGSGFDGDAWLLDLARRVRDLLRAAGAEIAHFKMSLADADGGTSGAAARLAAVSLVHSAGDPEPRRTLGGRVRKGLLTVNLRAEGAPELLARCVQEALSVRSGGVAARRLVEEAFRPGQPIPTHRVAAV